jgi:hypothetical protein
MIPAPIRIVLSLIAFTLTFGCGQKAADKPASAPTTAPAEATPGERADLSATLNRLTQSLRKFSAEHQRVPKSLDELVTAGYLTELPAAPPGKKYVFDDQLRVRLE